MVVSEQVITRMRNTRNRKPYLQQGEQKFDDVKLKIIQLKKRTLKGFNGKAEGEGALGLGRARRPHVRRERPWPRSRRADTMWTEQAVAINVSDPHCFLLSMRSGSSFLPQCGSRSGFREPNQCGSGSEPWQDFAVTKSWIDMKIYLVLVNLNCHKTYLPRYKSYFERLEIRFIC
jgi:hypothetical protein